MYKILLFSAIVSLSHAEKSEFARTADRVLNRLLLVDNGKSVDFEVLGELALTLWETNVKTAERKGVSLNFFDNGQAHHHRKDDRQHARKKREISSDNLAINQFINVGKQPSTSETLAHSSACDICASILSVVGPVINTDPIWPIGVQLAKDICMAASTVPYEVCDGGVESFQRQVRYIWPQLLTAPYSLCNQLLPQLGCGRPDDPREHYEIPIPDYPSNLPPAPERNVEKPMLTALLMTDMHIDPRYEIDTVANCLEPMCCRVDSTPTPDTEIERAGFWGHFGCDLPWWSWEELLRHANETHGHHIDVIYIAGDITPHDVWKQDRNLHMQMIEDMGESFDKWFPNTPVFYTLGNHEIVPVNLYPYPDTPAEFSAQWLYDKAADVWVKWMSNETIANSTIRYAGFFTSLIKPGWRVISINDVFCLGDDYFQFGDPKGKDPWGHLQWLIDVFLEAERNHEKVHILGHVAPGGSCQQSWSWNYFRIVDRFSHLIKGQFFGHAHKDEFMLWYDAKTLTKPIAVGWIGPPSTPYSENNIGYRLYKVDGETFEMMNYETWMSDLWESNNSTDRSKMIWRREYSVVDDYQLDNCSASEWARFADRLVVDDDMWGKFYNHWKVSLPGTNVTACTMECKRGILCDVYTGLSRSSPKFCERFWPSPTDDDSPDQKCSRRFIKKTNE